MTGHEAYGAAFFSGRNSAQQSAEAVVPNLIEMVQPRSVIDVGCGDGAWLKAFGEKGVHIFGVDGVWAADKLVVSSDIFTAADLTEPLKLTRTFDLALSLEVAEHLAETAAPTFVRSLTRLAPIILFSAAVPGQGGVNHVNEQWPGYWVALFRSEGFVPVDCLRRRYWEDTRVAAYYAQNMMFFVPEDHVNRLTWIDAALFSSQGAPLSLVHPGVLRSANSKRRVAKSQAKRAIRKAAKSEEQAQRRGQRLSLVRRKLSHTRNKLSHTRNSRWWRLGRRLAAVRD